MKRQKSAKVQESLGSVRLAGCNSVRGTRVLQQCRMSQRGVQWCEMQGVVAAMQRAVEGALISDIGSFNIGMFLA